MAGRGTCHSWEGPNAGKKNCFSEKAKKAGRIRGYGHTATPPPAVAQRIPKAKERLS